MGGMLESNSQDYIVLLSCEVEYAQRSKTNIKYN